jgi:ribonuclease BN (tRNA processing enzyme)
VVVELAGPTVVDGLHVRAWEVDHASGAPALALRLRVGGRTLAYTGDTAWTDVLVEAAEVAHDGLTLTF